MRKLFTPLPEVNDASDRLKIDVDSLGLPAGMDLGTIGVNIAATEGAARLCDTSLLSIIGLHIDEDSVDVQGQLNPDGSLTGAKIATKQATNDISVGLSLDKPNAKNIASVVALNNGARNSQVQETADLFSPTYQACKLDRQLRKGLRGLARENQLNLMHPRWLSAIYASADICFAALTLTSVAKGSIDPVSVNINLGFRAGRVASGVHLAHVRGMEAKPSIL